MPGVRIRSWVRGQIKLINTNDVRGYFRSPTNRGRTSLCKYFGEYFVAIKYSITTGIEELDLNVIKFWPAFKRTMGIRNGDGFCVCMKYEKKLTN